MKNLKPIQILFEDEYLLIVNKPAGIPSQPTVDPKRPSVYTLLQKQFPQLTLFLHHRLDKDTTGVYLLSKSSKANKPLTDMFREHKFQKTYLSINKKNLEWTQREWKVTNHLAPVKNGKKQLMRMVVVNKGGWYAETDFKIIKELKNSNLILLESKPLTGRTHQIRVHSALNKMPILGDFLYGGKSELSSQILLHAQKLEFNHPITRVPLIIESPLSEYIINTFL